jgi:hypothetical protein
MKVTYYTLLPAEVLARELLDVLVCQGALGYKIDGLDRFVKVVEDLSFEEFQSYLEKCWKDI